MTFPFKRELESGLIIVAIEIDYKYELKMLLDTGATNTTIDSNALYLLGYDLKDNIGTVDTPLLLSEKLKVKKKKLKPKKHPPCPLGSPTKPALKGEYCINSIFANTIFQPLRMSRIYPLLSIITFFLKLPLISWFDPLPIHSRLGHHYTSIILPSKKGTQ